MNNNNLEEQQFIKTDDNRIINKKCIRWVKKMNECLAVCTKLSGCDMVHYSDTHKICKINSPESYNKLNLFFE
jgi:hypothetical protein